MEKKGVKCSLCRKLSTDSDKTYLYVLSPQVGQGVVLGQCTVHSLAAACNRHHHLSLCVKAAVDCGHDGRRSPPVEPHGPHTPDAVAGGQGGGGEGGAQREPHPPHQAASQRDEADRSREVKYWDLCAKRGTLALLVVIAVTLCCTSGTSLLELASGHSWVIPGYSLMFG